MLSVMYFSQNRLEILSLEYLYHGWIHLELQQLHRFKLYALHKTAHRIS